MLIKQQDLIACQISDPLNDKVTMLFSLNPIWVAAIIHPILWDTYAAKAQSLKLMGRKVCWHVSVCERHGPVNTTRNNEF